MGSSAELQNVAVRDVLAALPAAAQSQILQLRDIILRFSAQLDEVGKIEECLKWGQISFVPYAPKSGTTLRFDYDKSTDRVGLFVHCQTRLIDDFRQEFPHEFVYAKNRALWFPCTEELKLDLLKSFIYRALTYHTKK